MRQYIPKGVYHVIAVVLYGGKAIRTLPPKAPLPRVGEYVTFDIVTFYKVIRLLHSYSDNHVGIIVTKTRATMAYIMAEK